MIFFRFFFIRLTVVYNVTYGINSFRQEKPPFVIKRTSRSSLEGMVLPSRTTRRTTEAHLDVGSRLSVVLSQAKLTAIRFAYQYRNLLIQPVLGSLRSRLVFVLGHGFSTGGFMTYYGCTVTVHGSSNLSQFINLSSATRQPVEALTPNLILFKSNRYKQSDHHPFRYG